MPANDCCSVDARRWLNSVTSAPARVSRPYANDSDAPIAVPSRTTSSVSGQEIERVLGEQTLVPERAAEAGVGAALRCQFR